MWGKKSVVQPCEGSHDASSKTGFFFYCIGCRTLVSRMLWAVPIGNPAKMLIGCFENLEFSWRVKMILRLWKGTTGWRCRVVCDGDLVMSKKALLHYFGSSRCHETEPDLQVLVPFSQVTCKIERPHEMALLQLAPLGRGFYSKV